MFRKYSCTEDDAVLYVGKTEDIKAMYKSINRNKHCNISPFFCSIAKFSDRKEVYGIVIEPRQNGSQYMSISTSDIIMSEILDGLWKQEK